MTGQGADEPAHETQAPSLRPLYSTVIPNTARLIADCRSRGVEIIFARIACLKPDGRDRSLSQKKPGFNYLLLPKDRADSQLVPELTPAADDIVVIKTTDSALTGTNLRLILRNMEIADVIVAGTPAQVAERLRDRRACRRFFLPSPRPDPNR